MAAEPSPEELDVVRDAVRQVVGDGKIAKFRDADLALLWRQRFQAKEDLLAATSEQLARINLPAALIAHLKAELRAEQPLAEYLQQYYGVNTKLEYLDSNASERAEPEGGGASARKRSAPDDAGLSRRGSCFESGEPTAERISHPPGEWAPAMKKQRIAAGVLGPDAGTWSPYEFVNWLVDNFGERIRAARSGPLPGVLRVPGAPLEAKEELAGHLLLEGRAQTFFQWLYWTATAYRRWRNGKSEDFNEYSRGIAQLLLLSIPGAGKTTQLLMIARQLHNWLQEGDDSCLSQLQGFMFMDVPDEKEVAKSKALLAALKRAAGVVGQYNTFLPVRVHKYPDAHMEGRLTPAAATAMRLLFAATSSLEEVEDGSDYPGFFADVERTVREEIRIWHVLKAMRLALNIPADEHLLLVPLVDEAHQAKGMFGGQSPKPVAWPLQFMSEVISIMNGLANSGDTFVLPVTASSHYAAVNISRMFTESGRSLAAQLSLRQLTAQQQEAIVLDMMNRVARAHGRPVRTEVPEAFRGVLHMVGSSPRTLALALDEVGGDTWRQDLDEKIVAKTAHHVPGILLDIQRRALRQMHWNNLTNHGCRLTRECLRRVAAHALTDTPVQRSRPVLANSPNCPLFGDFEAVGLVYYELEGEDVVGDLEDVTLQTAKDQQGIPANAGTLQVVARGQQTPLPAPKSSSQPDSSSAEGPTSHADCHSIPSSAGSPQAGAAGLQTPVPGPESSVQPGSTSTSMTGAYNLRSRARLQSPQIGAQSVRKGKTGLLVVQEGSQSLSPKISPGKLPFLQRHLSSLAPESDLGDEKVRMSVSPLQLRELLRQLGIIDDTDVSIFSDLALREAVLDKELIDIQMLAIKTEAYGLMGQTTVTPQQLIPGVAIPGDLGSVRFKIPQGHLTASGGQRTRSCKTAAELKSIVETLKQDILASLEPQEPPAEGKPVVRLGTVGPGNKGMDAMMVYLDEHDEAWTIFTQTKQTTADTAVIIKEIVANFASDLSDVVAVPQLQAPWKTWHQGADQLPIPRVTIGRQAPGHKGKLPFSRTVYIYVTDGTLSDEQNSIYEQALAAGHPWLGRTLIVSSATREGFYSRLGALTRDTLRNAFLDKLA